MAYPTGVNFQPTHPALGLQPISETSTTQKHPLGMVVSAFDHTYGEASFIYLKGVADTVAGALAFYDLKAGTTILGVSGGTGSNGPAAVAMSANVASQYGWYCVRGACPVKSATVSDNAQLYLTSTAGQLDDTAVANAQVDGILAKEATSGGFTTCELNYPNVVGLGGSTGSNTGDVTLAAIGSTANANGATLTGQVLNLQPASGSYGGIVTTGTQTIAGAKTFSGAISASNLSNTNSGDVTLTAVGSTPNANGATLTAQALNLQPASATYPGAMTAANYTRLTTAHAQLFTSTPAAKSATAVHAALAGNAGRAYLDLSALGDAKLDTVIQAHTGGVGGNSVTLAAVADGSGAGSITRVDSALTFHFENAVTTVANFETLVAALAGDDELIDVQTAGTGATVLVTASAFAATALANGSDTGNTFPGAFTNPDVPRCVSCVFGATWDAGDVTITGTDSLDAAIEETIADVAGSTVYGVKNFKTVTGATKQSYGTTTGTCSIGTGDAIGVAADVASAFGVLTADGTAEAVTVSATNNTFTPTTTPNGAVVFVLLANV